MPGTVAQKESRQSASAGFPSAALALVRCRGGSSGSGAAVAKAGPTGKSPGRGLESLQRGRGPRHKCLGNIYRRGPRLRETDALSTTPVDSEVRAAIARAEQKSNETTPPRAAANRAFFTAYPCATRVSDRKRDPADFAPNSHFVPPCRGSMAPPVAAASGCGGQRAGGDNSPPADNDLVILGGPH